MVERLDFLTTSDMVNLLQCAHDRALDAVGSSQEQKARCVREFTTVHLWASKLSSCPMLRNLASSV